VGVYLRSVRGRSWIGHLAVTVVVIIELVWIALLVASALLVVR